MGGNAGAASVDALKYAERATGGAAGGAAGGGAVARAVARAEARATACAGVGGVRTYFAYAIAASLAVGK